MHVVWQLLVCELWIQYHLHVLHFQVWLLIVLTPDIRLYRVVTV